MKTLKTLNQAGDTIVEVLIVLAVLSMAFGISYATANDSLSKARSSEEHTQAQGLLNSQVEALREAVANDVKLPTTAPFCMKTTDGTVSDNPGVWTNVDTDYAAADAFANVTSDCTQSSYYYESIVYTVPGGTAQPYFNLRVRWPGVGSSGNQQVEYTYSITPNSTAIATDTSYINCSGCTVPPPPPPPPPPAAPSNIMLRANGSTGTVVFVDKPGQSLNLSWTLNADTSATSTTCVLNGSGSKTYTYAGGTPSLSGGDNRDGDVGAYVSKGEGAPMSYAVSCYSTNGSGNSGTQSSNTVTIYVEQPFYRTWSWGQTDHFYTTSQAELGFANSIGYANEGVAGYIDQLPGPGEVPLYRSYGGGAITDHFYTTVWGQVLFGQAVGYGYEGVAGYVVPFSGWCPGGTTPWYGMFQGNGFYDQFYTTDWGEWATARDAYTGVSYAPYTAWDGVQACVYN